MAGILTTPFRLFMPFEKGIYKGVERNLRFDINALADFEEKTGMGISKLMHTSAVYAATRALLWAGLKHEDPSLTTERVGEYMSLFIRSGRNVNELTMEAMAAAQEQGAFGEPDEVSAGKIRANRDRVLALVASPDPAAPDAGEQTSDELPVLDVSPSRAASGGNG